MEFFSSSGRSQTPLKQIVLHSPEFPSGISEHRNSLLHPHVPLKHWPRHGYPRGPSNRYLRTNHLPWTVQVSTPALQRRNRSEHSCPQCTWVITVKIHLYQVKNMSQNKYVHFQSSSEYTVLFVGMLINFIALQKHKSSEKFTVVPSTGG